MGRVMLQLGAPPVAARLSYTGDRRGRRPDGGICMTTLRAIIAVVALGIAGTGLGACEKKAQPPTPAKPAPAQAPPPALPTGLGSLGDADAAIKTLRAGGLIPANPHAKTHHDV